MMMQLNPPVPVTTPNGLGLAHVLIDYGVEHDLLWVVFQMDGEWRTWRNQDVKAQANVTFGRVIT
jgi:hypothetical protein